MGADHNKNLVEVIGVSFSYGAAPVLEEINLSIHQGDYLALIGPNGAGKTTLLRLMLGLLKPTRGEIRLFGRDISAGPPLWPIAYVPQQSASEAADFPISVYEVVSLGRYSRVGLGRPLRPEDRMAVQLSLEQVGMWEQKDRLIGQLSGGQRQRAFIARALCSEPAIIFFDEPARGLDQEAEAELYSLLRRLNQEQGLTLVLVSHDIARATTEAMHIACLERRLVCHNSPADFLADSRLVEMFGQKARVIGHHHHL